MTRFKFRKQESGRYKRVSATYRRPRGFHSKMREHRKGNLRLPEAGFRGPVEVRSFHPCGLSDTLVFNESMLTSINPKLYAIRISATVAHPKKMKIAEGAKKLGLKVLNPPKAREKKKAAEQQPNKNAETTKAAAVAGASSTATAATTTTTTTTTTKQNKTATEEVRHGGAEK